MPNRDDYKVSLYHYATAMFIINFISSIAIDKVKCKSVGGREEKGRGMVTAFKSLVRPIMKYTYSLLKIHTFKKIR